MSKQTGENPYKCNTWFTQFTTSHTAWFSFIRQNEVQMNCGKHRLDGVIHTLQVSIGKKL